LKQRGTHLTLLLFYFVGNSDDYVSSYKQKICPSGGGGSGSGSGSGDGADEQQYEYSGSGQRYGKIDGYGYATDRCVCYTDGSGCECDSQDEGLAVRNVASYGPAVVCVDGSDWQDYSGGILTESSGCSAQFLDVNHCVQVVGYAFTNGNDNQDGDDNSGSGSGDGSGSGSGDGESSSRVGYWIVRNQWSYYWGMQGYAYVAMGANTCGILNDMIQAYL
jgi:hypothetical protein